ncbi:hypothetical protein Tco_0440066 [Tanacetum coccineum]
MGDEHLNTIPETKSDELIKSSVENLVRIPSEFEGISEDTCDVPVCEDPSTFHDLNDHYEILSDSNDDDTSSDDDDFEDIEYVSLEEVNNDKEEEEFDLEDILQIQDIEPDQGGLTSVVISNHSNDHLLELPEFESFHFDPSFPRPPLEPPDVEICLYFEPDAPMIDNFNELNDEQRGSDIDFSQNVEDDDSFIFVIQTFLPFLTYPEVSPLSCSTGSEDTIFDPGIST